MTGIGWIGRAAFVAAVLGLAGCGGGGGGDDGGGQQPPPVQPKAEGAYVGTSGEAADIGIAVFVLENDEFWTVYQSADGVLSGFLQGAGSSSNGSYTVADLREFNFFGGGVTQHSVSATYRPQESIEGTVTRQDGSDSYPFAATASAVTGYDYNQPASLQAVAGEWTGFYGNGNVEGPVSISPTGVITATTSANCSYSGTFAPRPSGKNVYDVSVTLGAAPCELPGQTLTGIGFVNTFSRTGQTVEQLVVMLVDASRGFGVTFVGER